MRYKVVTKEEIRITYSVTASSPEEAEELVGNGDYDDILYEDTTGLEFEQIRELNQDD